MLMAFIAILTGFISLVWSANRFVEGAAVTSKYSGMPPLIIGMVIVGFGTSAPECWCGGLSVWPSPWG